MQEKLLTFIETTIFEQDRKSLLTDDEYQSFQAYMLENYQYGDRITHTGGCQKIRWKLDNNKGKSGGVRVIYYALTAKGRLYLLTMYPKNVKDNLTAKEKAILKQIIEQLKD